MKGSMEILFMLAMVGLASANIIQDYVGKVQEALRKEVVAIENPILQDVVGVASKQCDTMKYATRLDYESAKDSHPDLSELTLNLITPAVHFTFSLSSLAEGLTYLKEFDPKAELKIFIHGFTDDPSKQNFQSVNDAFHSVGNSTILGLDASDYIRWRYMYSSTIVRLIGEILGDALADVYNKLRVDPSRIHCIGHSLGAHICSFTCKEFEIKTGIKIGRLTALDAALPCFSDVNVDLRVKHTDAGFVDAIHTDAGVFGMKIPVGQADYYPNGGSQQPGCLENTCNHSFCVKLFVESVTNPNGFPAVKCTDYKEFQQGNCSSTTSYMGLAAEPGTKGMFYLTTNEKPPYAANKEGLKYVNRDGVIQTLKSALLQG